MSCSRWLVLSLSLSVALPALATSPGSFDVEALRQQGPAGLQTVVDAWRQSGSPDVQAWHDVADAVAQQRGALRSELYWYTDMDRALQEAEHSGKPVLSLRMLGDLTEELSCANSRFFRTVLYSDAELAQWLDDAFVLHWSSERPVPVVTVDYGDGRVMQRTITGNSAHYVLDASGMVVDVLPGLYGAEPFRAALQESQELIALDLSDRLAEHDRRLQTSARQLASALSDLRGQPVQVEPLLHWLRADRSPDGAPVAHVPMRIAMSKAFVEMPILAAFDGRTVRFEEEEWVDVLPTDAEWTALGERMEVQLSDGALAQMRSERPLPPTVGSNEFPAMADAFALAVSVDSVRNELLLHSRVHARFAEGLWAHDFASVNQWTYSSLFLTPASDPWLGMVDATTYTGLTAAGILANDRG